MEHHSNHTTWLDTIADVVVIDQDEKGLPDLNNFAELLEKYANRKEKIAAVSAGSNVTGIIPPYYKIAEMIHKAGGLCFVDFACSAPYIPINMHPENELQKLDAVYFSPHKFLGGPGGTGIIVFDKKLYGIQKPDQPGGGTVLWTNPWGGHHYYKEIELREDGGTPAFLQTVKSALAVKLKEEMTSEKMLAREEELLDILWPGLKAIPGLHILAENIRERLGVLSFYFDDIHYNLVVKLLNDYFGVQVRSGCVCAGTYGHFLLNISKEESEKITRMIDAGDLSEKPGWVRMSIHPTMTNQEAEYLLHALNEVAKNHKKWGEHYDYNKHTNEFTRKGYPDNVKPIVEKWFNAPLH
jgi:selenocysteine lyase/cysteine desulfurase